MLSKTVNGGNHSPVGEQWGSAALPLLFVFLAALLSPFLYDLWQLL